MPLYQLLNCTGVAGCVTGELGGCLTPYKPQTKGTRNSEHEEVKNSKQPLPPFSTQKRNSNFLFLWGVRGAVVFDLNSKYFKI